MKNLTYAIFAILGCGHVMAIALYLAPPNPLSNSYRAVINGYINPIFAQNWKLFAPDPQPYSLKVFYQCEGDGHWFDPVKETLAEFQGNRLSHKGKLMYVYNGMIRSLINKKIDQCKLDSTGCSNPVMNEQVLESDAYKNMARYIAGFCGDKPNRFRVAKVFSFKYSQRNNPDRKREITFDQYEVM